MNRAVKVLQLSAVDVTARFLLLPLIDRLFADGYEVHIACSSGKHLGYMEDRGYVVHRVPIKRTIAPLSNLRSLFRLNQLIRREGFDIVHVHTPVAAALGRIAAKLARTPVIVYTAHGFYFHDLMPRWKRRVIIWIERWLGRCCTDMLFSQSAEDLQSAVREHIVPKEKVLWIGNGVDPRLFGLPPREDLRVELGLAPENKVVGFIGRLVREKGVEELFEVMGKVVQEIPTAKLLVVGDTLGSDRDCRVIERLKKLINHERLQNAVLFAGFREDIAELLAVMDVFVLPSHREGMPRTVLEAMAARKPVIATDIRGCREEVVQGVTGLLVPVGDSDELAKAILKLLGDDELARRMGEAGRKRVETEFDQKLVLERQSKVYDQLVEQHL